MPHRQNRDERDGRYTFDGDWKRMCVCGHTLGVHYFAAPHECCLHSFAPYTEERKQEAPLNDCKCQKFRLSRKRSKET